MKSDPLTLTPEQLTKMIARYGPDSLCHIQCKVCGSVEWNFFLNLKTLSTHLACAKCERPIEGFVRAVPPA